MAVGGRSCEGLADGLPDTKCLALSVSDAADDVIGVIRAGARGYVTKTITREELLDAIRRVHAGDAVFSPRLAGFVLDAFAGSVPVTSDPDMDRLTQREQEVLRLDRSWLHLQRSRGPHPRLSEDRRDPRLVGASQAAALEPPRADRLGDRSSAVVDRVSRRRPPRRRARCPNRRRGRLGVGRFGGRRRPGSPRRSLAGLELEQFGLRLAPGDVGRSGTFAGSLGFLDELDGMLMRGPSSLQARQLVRSASSFSRAFSALRSIASCFALRSASSDSRTLWANRSTSVSGRGGGALGRRRLGIGAIVVGDHPDLNHRAPMSLSQDQHDDDDEENEADEAPADVDTRCEQHAAGLTHRGDTANTTFDVASLRWHV